MLKEKLPKVTKPTTIIKWVVILIVFLIIANPTIIPFLSEDTKKNLSETWVSLFGDVGSLTSALTINWATIFRVVAIILLMVVITKITAFIIEKLRPKTGKGRSMQTLFRSAINYISTIITIFWCLSALGVNVSTLVAGAGIITLAISFGAQSLIEDVVTGIFLVFEDQFNVGDYIEVDGFRGTVENIGIRVTTVKGPGSNFKIINNSSIKNILNRSQSASIATTTVSVAYKEDVRRVEQVLNDLFPKMKEMYPEVFLEPPRNFGIDELGDSGVVFKIAATINEKDLFTAPRIMNREIKIAFDEAGVEIPFPQVVVHQEK
jgi:small conductance mechanosensitive channel